MVQNLLLVILSETCAVIFSSVLAETKWCSASDDDLYCLQGADLADFTQFSSFWSAQRIRTHPLPSRLRFLHRSHQDLSIRRRSQGKITPAAHTRPTNLTLICVRTQRKNKSPLLNTKSLPSALFTQHHANLFNYITLSHTRLPRAFVFNPVFMMS